MDANQERLQKRLDDLLEQASAVAAELQGIEQGAGTPHYDQIELHAHAQGQRFSRMTQSKRARELAAEGLADAACPGCGQKCRVQTKASPFDGWTTGTPGNGCQVPALSPVLFCRSGRYSALTNGLGIASLHSAPLGHE